MSPAYAACCLSLSSEYRFGGDPGQFLHGLTWMSLSKFELQSDAILIKDYSPSIGAVRPDHIMAQPRVTHPTLSLATEKMSLTENSMVSKAR